MELRPSFSTVRAFAISLSPNHLSVISQRPPARDLTPHYIFMVNAEIMVSYEIEIRLDFVIL